MSGPDNSNRDPARDGSPPASENEARGGQWHVVLLIASNEQSGEPTTIKTIPQSQIDSGQNFATEVLVGERIIAIFRHAGNWFAIDGMCSHQGGPLAEGVVRNGCVTCPWHGWQYDLATGIELINQQPLQESFPVREIENRVEVCLPE